MANVLALPVVDRQDLEKRLLTGTFVFSPDMPVSKLSRYGEDVWDYRDPDNKRLMLKKRKLRFYWTIRARPPEAQKRMKRTTDATPAMLENIKRFAYAFQLAPRLIGARSTKESISPVTWMERADGLIYLAAQLQERCQVTSWQEITPADLEVLAELPHTSTLVGKLCSLRMFASPGMRANLQGGPLCFTQADVDNVIQLIEAPDPEGYDPLPDALFKFLASQAQDVVSAYLTGLGLPRHDSSSHAEPPADLKGKYDLYVQGQLAQRKLFGMKDRTQGEDYLNVNRKWARRFAKAFGVGTKDFRKYLLHVQSAALVLLYLYTGMRYSEAASLHIGCARKNGRVWELFSTLIKNQPTNAPIDYDRWVAIPLLVDAVTALETLQPFHQSDWLLASIDSQTEDSGPMAGGSINAKLCQFLAAVDTQGVFKDWRLHGHQFRHGLVAQLAAIKTRLPYISMQLKHLTYAEQQLMDDAPADITTAYGNLSQNLLASLTGQAALNEARYRMALDLYGEGKRFAGGGADKHIAKTEAFFQGAGLVGDERKEFIRKRALRDIPILVTGFGICSNNLADVERLKNNPPQCYGDLQCNPMDCENAIVPENRVGAVKARLAKALREAETAPTEALTAYYKGLAAKYQSMLDSLGEPV